MMDKKKAADLLDTLIGMVEDSHGADYDTALRMGIEALSAQQLLNQGQSRTQSSDYIRRQEAIDALFNVDEYNSRSVTAIKSLPSVQSEIIRCGQCKYAEVADPEDSQDGYTCQFHRGSIWFSGSFCSWAERRTDETD